MLFGSAIASAPLEFGVRTTILGRLAGWTWDFKPPGTRFGFFVRLNLIKYVCYREDSQEVAMSELTQLTRITLDPAVMGGKACIRGLRVTLGTVVGLLAAGRSREGILKAYPYLELEDIDQALAYAAWRIEEREVPLPIA